MRELTRSSRAIFFLAAVLVFHCIIPSTNGQTNAVTNGRTTLLQGYDPASPVLTTLKQGDSFDIYCRVKDTYIYDDPWWLWVNVEGFGYGWVSDYYADCGYLGNCIVPECTP